ncbi:MAG: hypothetical protein ACQEWL_17865 [Pseudomonadota bacterium]
MQLQEMSLNEYLQSRLIASGFDSSDAQNVIAELEDAANSEDPVTSLTAGLLWEILDKTTAISLAERLVGIINRAMNDGQYSAAIQAIELLHREFPAQKWFTFILKDFNA